MAGRLLDAPVPVEDSQTCDGFSESASAKFAFGIPLSTTLPNATSIRASYSRTPGSVMWGYKVSRPRPPFILSETVTSSV